MKNIIKDYDTFLVEGFSAPSATTLNTSGMGNVTSGAYSDSVFEDEDDSADQDKGKKHIKPAHENNDSWMRPNGNYGSRSGLVHNYTDYQDIRQSMTRFQIGDEVRCVHQGAESNGLIGKIVAFEDANIRWEVNNSEPGIGQTSRQYRCLPAHLELIN